MPIYMNYASLAIKGDVTEEGHKDWIELDSFQLGVGRGISSPVGASADRESSAPSVSEISVSKGTDCSTPKLLAEALQGEGKSVQIDFCRTDQGQLAVYLSYTLSNCMISRHLFNSAADRPSEKLGLNFTKLEYKAVASGASHGDGSPEAVTFDVATARIV
jgi:type VI secretion system secreted protein Hcp